MIGSENIIQKNIWYYWIDYEFISYYIFNLFWYVFNTIDGYLIMVRRIVINLIETVIFGSVVVGGTIGLLMLVGVVKIV